MRQFSRISILLLGALVSAAADLPADEGMWLFNNPPRKLLKTKYDFDPTDKWLEHLQKSAVRFNSGGSGSFVSSEGLVMTNHHVGADALQKLSTESKDYIKLGFFAKTRAEEVKAVDLELNVLQSIEDVTAKIDAAVKDVKEAGEAQKARRAVMNTIEKESLDKTGLRSDVVTLYQGGQYHLYRYKKYTDVRLVFAPEKDIAFFGGDPDNFEYPRYDLDVCFFRVYENDKPAKIEHYLAWSKDGAKDGELVFVAGHPGKTDRLNTVAHLEFLRDKTYPITLGILRRREVLLRTFGERSLENARRAQDDLFGIQNTRKAMLGGLGGLQDPAIMKAKQANEDKLLAAISSNKQHADAAKAFDQIRDSLKEYGKIIYPNSLLERGSAFNSELFHTARTLVRLADEKEKPNAERLREYRESNLESLEQSLFSEAPIYTDIEILKLADSLSMFMEFEGADTPLLQKILDGKSPQDRAAALVNGSKLADVKVRKQLAEGGKAAIAASNDPMIKLALLVDGPARRVRKVFEDKVEEPQRQAYAKISQAKFAVSGTDLYPDATFTLRLAFGTVKGYEESGKMLPPWTTMGGAYKHAAAHENHPPFELPPSWIDHKKDINLETPFNFVSTPDIIGGNSGSPVVNRAGEVVGLIFDGNIYSLVLDFVYSDDKARAISVHSASIVESLKKIYGGEKLGAELGK